MPVSHADSVTSSVPQRFRPDASSAVRIPSLAYRASGSRRRAPGRSAAADCRPLDAGILEKESVRGDVQHARRLDALQRRFCRERAGKQRRIGKQALMARASSAVAAERREIHRRPDSSPGCAATRRAGRRGPTAAAARVRRRLAEQRIGKDRRLAAAARARPASAADRGRSSDS